MPEDHLPVYRLIDERLVPLPGNKRDPSRRYSLVNGEYHLEFTDEQERQRDEDEAKRRVSRPRLEADRKKRQEEFTAFKESLQYERRVVAFLDIMGWGEAIELSRRDEELTRNLGVALRTVQLHEQMFEWTAKQAGEGNWPGDPQLTHFSDCILISVTADSFAYGTLVGHVSSLVSQMFRLGYLIRGAITAGPLIHRSGMAYGPALIEAYKLERDVAKSPRIILAPELAEAWGQGDSYYNKDGTLIGHAKTWRQDSDGLIFFDYLQPFMNSPIHPVNALQFKAQLDQARRLIDAGLSNNRNDKHILEKYVWMATYFNSIVDEYSEFEFEIIQY